MAIARAGGAMTTQKNRQLTLFRSASRLRAAVTAREFFNTSGGIDEFLFAGEKRMASGANADFNITTR